MPSSLTVTCRRPALADIRTLTEVAPVGPFWEDEPEPVGPQLPPRPVSRATVVVGPEGGLERSEADTLRAAGAIVGGLGPRILRTETAGPVGLALLQARYGDLGGDGS